MEFLEEALNVGDILLPFVIGCAIMPTVHQLKKTTITNWVKPFFLTGVLSICTAFLIDYMFPAGMTSFDIIKDAFASITTATALNELMKLKTATKQ